MGRTVSDRTYTVQCPNNIGPLAVQVSLNLPDQAEGEMFAWIGNFGSSNAYIFEGVLSAVQCANALTTPPNTVDCIMALSGSAVAHAPINSDIRVVTVFFETENISGQNETVSFRIKVAHSE